MKRLRTRNRPRKGGGGPIFPAPLAIVLILVTSLSLAYLWLHNRYVTLGQEIKKKERGLEELKRQVVNEEFKWSNMTSPQNMRRLLEAHKLVMTWPAERDVVRLGGTPGASLPGSRQLAQGRSRGRHD